MLVSLPMLIMLLWLVVLLAMIVAEAPPNWRETEPWIRVRIWWLTVKGWAPFARSHAADWLWFKTVWRFRAWRYQRRVADRERKALPIYIRCAEHKDFGGSCENDATWADVSRLTFPTHCDDCVVQDGSMKRVGLTERPRLPQESRP